MKSSYPLGNYPNLGLWLHRGILKTNLPHYEPFRRILKNNVTQYDVTLIYAGFVNTGENTNGFLTGKLPRPFNK